MSQYNNAVMQTFKQENTTLVKYRLAKLWTEKEEVVAATDGSAPIIWITNESANGIAGNPIWLAVWGTMKLTILAATTKGAYIKATTGGKWVLTTTDTDEYIGRLLETTTVANQVAEVQIFPGRFAG